MKIYKFICTGKYYGEGGIWRQLHYCTHSKVHLNLDHILIQ